MSGVYPLQENTVVDVASTPSEVQVDESKNQIVETTTQQADVTINTPDTNIYTAGVQGPQGPAGSSEEEVPYNQEVDFVGEDVIYKGEAVPGTATADALWRIKKTTSTTGGDGQVDYKTQWASGNANLDKIWDNRLELSYS